MDKLINNWNKISPPIPKYALVGMGLLSCFFAYINPHVNDNVWSMWIYSVGALILSIIGWKLYDLSVFFLGRNRI